MGLESEAMILATSGDDYFSLFEVPENISVGARVK
jgi:hypothetical protein